MSPAPDDDAFAPLPLSRARPFPVLRLTLRAAGAAALIAALSLFARDASVPSEARSGSPALSAFVPSAKGGDADAVAPPTPRYGRDDPAAIDPTRTESARTDAAGLRAETLAQGSFEAFEAPFLRMTVTEGEAPEPATGLFVTLARRAAEGPGLSVLRTGTRGRIETKFGPVETLEATLSGTGTRVCAGFSSLGASPVRLDGWLCAPLGQPPEPRAVVCALDAVVLAGPADAALAAAFRAIDARRDRGCERGATAREIAAETGSIARPRRGERRHAPASNAAPLRRSAPAQP